MPIVLFCWGMWSYPIAMLGPERNLVPGDMGDARFNNYVLEHFHAYATGRLDYYWDAPMMYPWKNVIALSDNLLGTAPIYSAFRHAGYERETSFQLWLLVLFALNYWCAFLALRAWTGRSWLAACGAFFFAFGIYGVGQMGNAQVAPRFLLPVGLYLLWRWLSTARPRYLVLAALAAVAQFYCGIYLGFLLLYAMACMVAGHALIYKGGAAWLAQRKPVLARTTALTIILAAVLLAPLMFPYMQVAGTMGAREFHEAAASIPRPASLFFAHPSAWSWQDLTEHGKHLPEWWCHYLFVGGVPWLAVLLAPFLVARKRLPMEERRVLAAITVAWLLAVVMCMDFGGFSPWKVVHALPGFSALRSMDRILHVHAVYFMLIMVLVAGSLVRNRRWALAMALLMPALIIVDNRLDVDRIWRFDKHEAQRRVEQVARHMEVQDIHGRPVLAYGRIVPSRPHAAWHKSLIETNLTAILAAQELGKTIVNGYSGSYPDTFTYFFDLMDHYSLQLWCSTAGCDTSQIQWVDNVGLPVSHTERLCFRDHQGRYLSADQGRGDALVADRWEASGWEAFVLVHLQDGRAAILAHNDRWVWTDLLNDGHAMANAPEVGDFALFTVEQDDTGRMAFKAGNGKYLAVADNGVLTATADTIHPGCWFSQAPLPGKEYR